MPATSIIISQWVLAYHSAHSLTATLLQCCPTGKSGNQQHDPNPTPLHYPDTELTSGCPLLIMPSAWLGSEQVSVSIL